MYTDTHNFLLSSFSATQYTALLRSLSSCSLFFLGHVYSGFILSLVSFLVQSSSQKKTKKWVLFEDFHFSFFLYAPFFLWMPLQPRCQVSFFSHPKFTRDFVHLDIWVCLSGNNLTRVLIV